MSNDSRRPQAFALPPGLEAAPNSDAKRQKINTGESIIFEAEGDDSRLPVLAPGASPSRGLRWGTLFVASIAALVALWAGFGVVNLVEGLFTRSAPLGWLASGIAGLAGISVLGLIVREVWGLTRLSRVTHIQADAALAINFNDETAAARATTGLLTLHRGRHDALWGLENIRQHKDDVMDVRDRLRLVERFLIEPRDQDAHRIIARTARRVTLITTVTPTATLDILIVAHQNLRMIRELAVLYGGRPSALATLRLVRMVLGHLAVTGGLALSDNLLQHVLGKGLIGRLSARFGEGAVNGIMTARIGIAARDVCRPVPQDPVARETLGNLLKELLSFGDKTAPG